MVPAEEGRQLGMVNEVPMTLVAKPQMAANSYAELVAWLDRSIP